MASDEIVWQVINQQFCSFKLKTTKDRTFCRNEHNVTGLCLRQSCPLANSRYATVRANEATGALVLYMKSIERAHLPSQWWEKITLPKNYTQALDIIDKNLMHWPKFLVHKCKQRLTRLTQVQMRIRHIAKEERRLGEKVVPRLAPKIRKREEVRERKAEAAAKVERAIERELVERLRSGAYGDRPLNVQEGLWKKVMMGLEREGEGARDEDLDEGIEEEQEVELEYEKEPEVEYVSDLEGESEDEGDMGDLEDWLGGRSDGEETDITEDDDEEGTDDENEEEEESGSDEDEEEEDNEALREALSNLKRKRPAEKPSKPSKKPVKGTKGPLREIEYEIEREPPARQALLA